MPLSTLSLDFSFLQLGILIKHCLKLVEVAGMTLTHCFDVMWFHMHCCLNWHLSWFILKGGGGAFRLYFSKWECAVAMNGETPDVLASVHCGLRCLFFWREKTGLSCVSFLLKDSWGVSLTKNASFYN